MSLDTSQRTGLIARTVAVLGAVVFIGLTTLWCTDQVSYAPTANVASAELPTVSAQWIEQVSGEIAQLEYRITPVDGRLQAPNRSQNLRTVFAADGVTVTPRDASDVNQWSWTWRTTAWGREELMEPQAVTPQSYVTRVEYPRDGLAEWYVNGEDGIEQGFTVHHRPSGEGVLRIVGRCDGNLQPRLTDAGIDFIDARDVRVLRYDELKTFDARGREIPGTITMAGAEITLAIDDRDAVYPLTIDPIVSSPPWFVDGPHHNAHLGWTMAPAGDVNGDGYSDVIVGSPEYTSNGWTFNGRMWVYLGTATGLETEPHLDLFGEQDGCDFGYSVSSAGDINGDGYDDVLVGSPSYEDGLYDNGRIYLWYGSADGLAESSDWDISEWPSAQFGYSVSPAGDLNGDGYDDILIGDPFASTSDGRVWVEYGSSTGPSGYSADWNDLGRVDSWLGYSVSTAGDINGDGYDDVVAGAPYYTNTEAREGAIYVYYGAAGGVSDTPVVIQSDEEYMYMGYRVALAGDVNGDGYSDVLVGCIVDEYYCDEEDQVRLYLGSADGLQTTPAWTRIADDENDGVGRNIATAGDVNGDGYADVLVGISGHDGAVDNIGKVELYLGYYDGLSTDPVWTDEGPEEESCGFGQVATAGDVDGDGYSDFLVGAPNLDLDTGRLYCYHGGGDGPRDAAGWVTESNQSEARYGFAVASAGDVNADGFDDLLVGAPYFDYGQVDEGAVFLFMGGNTGLTWIPLWYAESNQAYAHLGYSVASAGDVNGDGLPDIIVGAPDYQAAGDSDGAAWVWHSIIGGIPNGTPDTADWSYYSGQAHTEFGCSVDCAGDVNADGYADVIVGAWQYDAGTENEGGAFVFHGSASGLSTEFDWFHDTNHAASGYGFSVSSAGDMNGDGYSDVIVGAPHYNHPSLDEGLACVYLGSEDGVLNGAPWWYTQSDQEGAMLGYSVDCAGDVNGDGYSDVIVGAPWWDGIAVDAGAAMVWHGAATPPAVGNPDNADRAFYWIGADARFGFRVASAGDLNNDGYGDIVMGCPRNDGVYNQEGFAIVYLGSEDGVAGSMDWLQTGTMDYAHFGAAVGTAGDVNGDGFSDLVVGADMHSQPEGFEGRAYVYYGGGGRGVPRAARQWQSDLSGRLAPMGRSDSETGFGLTARARTARGRDRARLEYEVKPYGQPFDGTGTVLGEWVVTGAPGNWTDLSATVAGLTSATQYTWRMRVHGHSPFFPSTPWQTLSWNGATEFDLRTNGGISPVHESDVPPSVVAMSCYPNPFNPKTTLKYEVPTSGDVRLTIFDIRGRRVQTLVDEVQTPGWRAVDWRGTDDTGQRVASGVYMAVLETAGGRCSSKLSLVK